MFPDGKSRWFLDPQALARLASVPLAARRPMQGSVSGRHASPHRGASVEFAEYRRYVPGDDLRRLHWRALGRSDRYYVKEFEADTNLRCCLVLDTSGSMGFGSGKITKLQYGKYLAATLAYLASRQHDAIGLILFDEEVREHRPPASRPGQLNAILHAIDHAEPGQRTDLDVPFERFRQ